MFLGSIERDQWNEMGLSALNFFIFFQNELVILKILRILRIFPKFSNIF